MIGCRLPDGWHSSASKPGDYWRTPDGHWEIVDPAGAIGRLDNHTVTEHEDGTITVSPSILNPNPGGWHGFLERGHWRSV